MRPSRLLRFAGLFLIALITLSAASAFAAANSVPASLLDEDSFSITANALKPAECAALNLTNIVVNADGSGGPDLILGTAGGNTINGRGGDDCIVGGGGDDRLTGLGGADVLLGGGGDDKLLGGQGDDFLYGGPGNDDCDGGGGTDSGDSCEISKKIP